MYWDWAVAALWWLLWKFTNLTQIQCSSDCEHKHREEGWWDKKWNPLKYGVGEDLYGHLEVPERRESESWGQMKPQALPEAKMTKSKLPYSVRRQGSLEETTTLWQTEDGSKRGRPTTRWTDNTREAPGTSPQQPSGAVEDRTLWAWVTPSATRSQSRVNST